MRGSAPIEDLASTRATRSPAPPLPRSPWQISPGGHGRGKGAEGWQGRSGVPFVTPVCRW
jgi:hypothetical protein